MAGYAQMNRPYDPQESTMNWPRVAAYGLGGATAYGMIRAGGMKAAKSDWGKAAIGGYKNAGGISSLLFGNKDLAEKFVGEKGIQWGNMGYAQRSSKAMSGISSLANKTNTRDAMRSLRKDFSRQQIRGGLQEFRNAAPKGAADIEGTQRVMKALSGKEQKITSMHGLGAWASAAEYTGRGWQRGAAMGARGAMMAGAAYAGGKALSFLNPFSD